ncbi:unnamed protein product [Rotaria magnacalcarata]|uniref:Uncharacterized protein n=2 Tax=Rotaria magnacalcarata TaxID=392030 RepID=A0A816UWD6_9BILA|nr:unnamed protein product [Rotaria magnacalcarata]
MQLVSETFAPNPQIPQRRASLDLSISCRTLQHLMQDLNLKPYNPRLLQPLNKDDRNQQLEFCNVTSQTYLQMLKDHIIPQLEEHSAFQIMIWQQDDAPLHCGKIVRDSLDDTFLNWIGRRGTVQLLS